MALTETPALVAPGDLTCSLSTTRTPSWLKTVVFGAGCAARSTTVGTGIDKVSLPCPTVVVPTAASELPQAPLAEAVDATVSASRRTAEAASSPRLSTVAAALAAVGEGSGEAAPTRPKAGGRSVARPGARAAAAADPAGGAVGRSGGGRRARRRE